MVLLLSPEVVWLSSSVLVVSSSSLLECDRAEEVVLDSEFEVDREELREMVVVVLVSSSVVWL